MDDESSIARWRAGISRRSFVTAGIAGAVLGAAPATESRPAQQGARFAASADVIVVGSGAAGAAAALFAHAEGATVLMVEKAGHSGGTSAKSGGNVWIPNNRGMRDRGLSDPKPDFLRFAARSGFPAQYDAADEYLGIGAATHGLLSTFYDEASSTVETLGKWQALRLERFHFGPDSIPDSPDYNENLPENVVKRGRVLAPFAPDGSMGIGNELMRQAHEALARLKIACLHGERVTDLVRAPDGSVVGVETRNLAGRRQLLSARRGVVFASGGFTHNRDLLQRFHSEPVAGGCAIGSCTGDFVAIAEGAGAQLGNMGNAWRAQVVLEDAIQYTSTPNNVWAIVGDSVILVNRDGKRVINEKRNYHDRTKAMYAWNPNEPGYPNRLMFMIYDERVAQMYAGIYPLPEVPTGLPFVLSAPTLDELSRRISKRLAEVGQYTGNLSLADGFESNLKSTVARFNDFARTGMDLDFGRGNFEYDQHYHMLLSGQPSERFPRNSLPNATMHPLDTTGPFYAIILAPGTLDTNGGAVIDTSGRVLDSRNRPISRLYGAGNCIASAAGQSYWGAGATLGNAITFGAIAGRSAARQPPWSARA